MFGGLEICAVEAVVGKDGRENIIEADDCAMSLMGETQEEDRRLISDLGMISLTHKRFPFFHDIKIQPCQMSIAMSKHARRQTGTQTQTTQSNTNHAPMVQRRSSIRHSKGLTLF